MAGGVYLSYCAMKSRFHFSEKEKIKKKSAGHGDSGAGYKLVAACWELEPPASYWEATN